jgi:2-keto-4-pentenoate hydratase/2-oxohepta-3-ene-1,7-dioic acid hydratase in catechol pathway
MRLVTFRDRAGTRVGVMDAQGNGIVDLAAFAPTLPRDLLGLLRAGPGALALAGRATPSRQARLDRSAVELLAPIPRPARNIFCVGKNFRDHAREFQESGLDATAAAAPVPEAPVFFTKPPSTVIGPAAPIPAHLDHTGSTDYEGELAVVIGRGGRGIGRAQAASHVFGYTIVNDVTARALQQLHRQWFLGKGLDGYCPMGPAIVTADEIPEPAALVLETRVNGELRQRASLADLIFDIPFLIESLSRGMSLEPGDIIATGTCAGVGIGFRPPRFLSSGDRVAVTIEPIGTLENPVA